MVLLLCATHNVMIDGVKMSPNITLLVTATGTFVTLIATAYNIWRSCTDAAMQQASRVTVWSENGKVILSNQNQQPVFEVIVSSVVIDSDPEPTDLSEAMMLLHKGTHGMQNRGSLITNPSFRRKVATLMPGAYAIDPPVNDKRTVGIITYELVFRDSGNRCWMRLADGRLKRQRFKKPSNMYSENSIPQSWAELQICNFNNLKSSDRFY